MRPDPRPIPVPEPDLDALPPAGETIVPVGWTPASWRDRTTVQQPTWESDRELEKVLARIRQLPPIVSMGEVDALKQQIAEAGEGKRFILQGGDCAERFSDCNSTAILRKLKILMQMGLVLSYGARRPVTRVGRMAGQFAKPRSNPTEVVDGRTLPVFRGDNVNEFAPDPEARRCRPERLERGYFVSASTLNFIRALVDGGFANLRSPEHWQLDFIPNGHETRQVREEYLGIAERIRDALDYLDSLGIPRQARRDIDFFTSHEGLILAYEEALTRRARAGGRYYNLGAHFLWIGDRTRMLDGGHVEYFRGLANPIGIKLGPTVQPEEVLELLERLNPEDEPGRVTLITRFGRQRVRELLPKLAAAVKRSGRVVTWSCDPMHGNTTQLGSRKTRNFTHVVSELVNTFEVHREEGTVLGGLHFEMTGENVTECIGGLDGVSEADLDSLYTTGCDPRLNYGQSMEIAFVIARMLTEAHRNGSAQSPW